MALRQKGQAKGTVGVEAKGSAKLLRGHGQLMTDGSGMDPEDYSNFRKNMAELEKGLRGTGKLGRGSASQEVPVQLGTYVRAASDV